MHRQYLMLILVLVFLYDALGQGTDSQTNPVIIYSCDDSNTITSFNVTIGDFEKIRLVNENGFCDPETYDQAGVLKCIADLKKNGGSALSIMYEDLKHRGFTGGMNIKYFNLSCKKKSSIQIASLTDLDVKPSAGVKLNEVFAVISKKPTLTIKNKPATIYVGTQIKLQLEIDEAYILLPETCTAYQQGSDPKEYQFWTRCDKTQTDESIMPDLFWASVNEQHKTHATIDMYAFRFIDTSTINLKCDVLVCPKDAAECKEQCTPIGRKRRQANTNITTATASLTFDVLENKNFGVNGCQALSAVWYIYATGLGIMYWITVNKF